MTIISLDRSQGLKGLGQSPWLHPRSVCNRVHHKSAVGELRTASFKHRRQLPSIKHCRAVLNDLQEPDQQAKFLPFTAHNEIRRRIISFQKTFPVPNGKTLLVRPVTQDWVEPTAELLAASFAEALGFGPYRNYLKRQIRKYVQHHMVLPPKAVVLVALLVDEQTLLNSSSSTSSSSRNSSQESGVDTEGGCQAFTVSAPPEPSSSLMSKQQQQPAETAAAAAGFWSGGRIDDDAESSSGSNDDATPPWLRNQTIDTTTSSSSSGISSTSMAGSTIAASGFKQGVLPSMSGGGVVDTSPDEVALGDGMGIASTVSSECSDEEERTAWEDGEFVVAALEGAELIGVVELSFSESTRSKYMTLNPPADRPYLCNMAIDPESRGLGFGSLLLSAAEELVREVGENIVYLHLRFQDKPAAGLYQKAGYQVAEVDSMLVRFLGLDRRYLMRKVLASEG